MQIIADNTKVFGRCLLLTFVAIVISNNALAWQQTIEADTTDIYKNIENYATRNRFTTFLHKLIFKPVASIPKNKGSGKEPYNYQIQKSYRGFEGKVIRNIEITTLDPFGYSVIDTTVSKLNILQKAGNSTHFTTQSFAIRNLLLIRRNQPFNSLLVKESERLVRSRNFVQEVSFFVFPAGTKSDSVDIVIRVKDKWSIAPRGSVSEAGMTIGLTDINFIGMGHEFRNVYSNNFVNGVGLFNTDYFIPSIKDTYISTKLHWGLDGYGNYRRYLTLDRPFYSPVTKWAAGVSFSSESKKDSLKDINSAYVPVNQKFNTQDYWAGKAFPIFDGGTEAEQVTNLILTMRFLRLRYSEEPSARNDPYNIFSDEDFFLAGIGVSTRQYLQDVYIFNWGLVEDVPIGMVLGMTTGYQKRNNSGRFYLGMKLASGDYHKWGYLSYELEYGTFFKSSAADQGVINADANYFTGLFTMGKWKFRQFVKPAITIGINRTSYDTLTLKEDYGLSGFNSFGLSGTDRLLLTLQLQSYSPWNLAGFRFGPFITCSLGMLGDAKSGFRNSKVYSQLGFGVLIKNKNLVFSSFQISISFYPMIPGYGQNVFKLNTFRTDDIGFKDFELGKPEPVIFR